MRPQRSARPRPRHGSGQDPGVVTGLLAELDVGNMVALEALFPMVYDELRHLAHRHRSRWDGDTTMGTTALVHEVYLKLAAGDTVSSQTRLHVMRTASRAMRQILSNYARDRYAAKRGGGALRVSLEHLPDREAVSLSFDERCEMLLEVDDALRRLERVDKRLNDIVECRFFGGLSITETAGALGVSPATVRRDWALARAWLFRELSEQAPERRG